ncbi:hypothetical protein HII31_02363 [Pseudocercospora fuligena]|uniref:DUF3176 domain containing protein n=1 Tax=Pseudocercospora fuligena TaxID=685502 RepID=A0A8H6RU76_9PEZI|nr:hypothetical protein HII31_02363 [Pseudocercospora fuligena]
MTSYKPVQGPYQEPEQIALHQYSSPEITGYSTHRRPFEREHSDFSYAGAGPSGSDDVKLIPTTFHQPADSSSQIKEYVPSRLHPHRIFTNWWREAVAIFLLVGSAIATFATLYPYQGRPIPQWPLKITPNALLSVYMLILRGSVGYLLAEGIAHQKWRWFDEKERPLYDLALHDEASRGPYGAVKLLFRTSIKHVWHWLGCILVIVAIFIGPFSQQVIQYVDFVVPVESGTPLASIPRNNVFKGAGVHDGAGQISFTAPEQAAINAGTFAPGGQVPFVCPSGNCTFPQYTTVGYCSQCQDISSSLKIEYRNFTGGEVDNNSPGCRTTAPPHGLSSTWLNLTSARNYSTFGLADYKTFQLIFGLPYGPFDPNTGLAPTGCDDPADKDSWRCRSYGAANCTMYPCMRTFSGNITDNVLSETLITETPEDGPLNTMGYTAEGYTVFAAINATCLTSSELEFLISAGYQRNASTEWISYNMTGNATQFADGEGPVSSSTVTKQELVDFEKEIEKRGCLYIMDLYFANSLFNFLEVPWTGNLTGYTSNDGLQLVAFEGPQVLNTLYNFGDFSFNFTDSLFKNLSTSLTNYMRTTPGYNSTALTVGVSGSQFTNKTCLKVAWPWLSLPYLLVLFTLIYVAGALLSLGSLSHGMRTWRGSPLPMIFHGPQHVASRAGQSRDLQDIKDMERIAKHMRVRLVPGADGSMQMHVQDTQGVPR